MPLYCDVYIAFSKPSFISAVSLLSSYIAHFNVLHRLFTLSTCFPPLVFMSVHHAKKKTLTEQVLFSLFVLPFERFACY